MAFPTFVDSPAGPSSQNPQETPLENPEPTPLENPEGTPLVTSADVPPEAPPHELAESSGETPPPQEVFASISKPSSSLRDQPAPSIEEAVSLEEINPVEGSSFDQDPSDESSSYSTPSVDRAENSPYFRTVSVQQTYLEDYTEPPSSIESLSIDPSFDSPHRVRLVIPDQILEERQPESVENARFEGRSALFKKVPQSVSDSSSIPLKMKSDPIPPRSSRLGGEAVAGTSRLVESAPGSLLKLLPDFDNADSIQDSSNSNSGGIIVIVEAAPNVSQYTTGSSSTASPNEPQPQPSCSTSFVQGNVNCELYVMPEIKPSGIDEDFHIQVLTRVTVGVKISSSAYTGKTKIRVISAPKQPPGSQKSKHDKSGPVDRQVPYVAGFTSSEESSSSRKPQPQPPKPNDKKDGSYTTYDSHQKRDRQVPHVSDNTLSQVSSITTESDPKSKTDSETFDSHPRRSLVQHQQPTQDSNIANLTFDAAAALKLKPTASEVRPPLEPQCADAVASGSSPFKIEAESIKDEEGRVSDEVPLAPEHQQIEDDNASDKVPPPLEPSPAISHPDTAISEVEHKESFSGKERGVPDAPGEVPHTSERQFSTISTRREFLSRLKPQTDTDAKKDSSLSPPYPPRPRQSSEECSASTQSSENLKPTCEVQQATALADKMIAEANAVTKRFQRMFRGKSRAGTEPVTSQPQSSSSIRLPANLELRLGTSRQTTIPVEVTASPAQRRRSSIKSPTEPKPQPEKAEQSTTPGNRGGRNPKRNNPKK